MEVRHRDLRSCRSGIPAAGPWIGRQVHLRRGWPSLHLLATRLRRL